LWIVGRRRFQILCSGQKLRMITGCRQLPTDKSTPCVIFSVGKQSFSRYYSLSSPFQTLAANRIRSRHWTAGRMYGRCLFPLYRRRPRRLHELVGRIFVSVVLPRLQSQSDTAWTRIGKRRQLTPEILPPQSRSPKIVVVAATLPPPQLVVGWFAFHVRPNGPIAILL
jgi:hypothetical protein